MMSGIRGQDTAPERIVRRFLHRHGFRFRLHVPSLPGRPDIVLPRYRVAVQVQGCFWHQHPRCRFAVMPSTNVQFWRRKLRGNVARDRRNALALRAAGWHLETVWECELAPDMRRLRVLVASIRRFSIMRKPTSSSARNRFVGRRRGGKQHRAHIRVSQREPFGCRPHLR